MNGRTVEKRTAEYRMSKRRSEKAETQNGKILKMKGRGNEARMDYELLFC